MYQNDKKYLYESELTTKLKITAASVTEMIQKGIIVVNEPYCCDGESRYYFENETLYNHLIARNLNCDINDNLPINSLINQINTKIEKFISIGDAIILVIVDRFTNDPKRMLQIIRDSKLRPLFNPELFRIIKFNTNQIKIIQKSCKTKNLSHTFYTICGYSAKPFNCVNYFNKIIFENHNILFDINKEVEFYSKT
jgi:hypothetical protein